MTKKLDSSIHKKLLTILRSLKAFLLQMNRDNNGNSIDLILVGRCPLSAAGLLSDYRKEKIIRSMNLINPIRPGGGGKLRGPDDRTHSCQSETSHSMMPKLCDF